VRRVAPPWKKTRPTVCVFAGRGFYPGTVTRLAYVQDRSGRNEELCSQ
jgi:hypothetical protein